ncbi:MAG TPA: CpsB/CapC family capsule biosynthesis tyrosine phosphatase [Solirubrobacteraceae bacterium]|nr:CpsB/CapC family capsule biosynthesis tyrosine phosphatase [Solirubrobacteraceae bacterium]
MIDLHSHVLPGLDDGPETLADSLELARAALAAGTHTLVATPHLNRLYDVDAAIATEAVAKLRERLTSEGIELELLLGAEIAVDRLASMSEAELHALRLGGGPYLLIESPLSSGVRVLSRAVRRLNAEGHRVLLAHPERCPGFQRDPDALRALVAEGALCSITAGALEGRFGGIARRFALTLLREGLVHDVASDAHDAHRRSPDMRPGLTAAAAELPGAQRQIEWLTERAPAAILAGDPLPPRPPLEPRGWRRRLLGRP